MLYILHENDQWLAPFCETFTELGLPFSKWHMASFVPDLSVEPPRGIFYVRMSASAHTRGHLGVPELTAGVLCWLERHGRRVINGSGALDLELSKVRQYQALMAHKLPVPLTYAARSPEQLLSLARNMPCPFVTKHNRAGMGLGVERFDNFDAFANRLDALAETPPVDGVTLLQVYIDSPESSITRCEFVGGKFVYALSVDTSEGFELCPANNCSTLDQHDSSETKIAQFEIMSDYMDPIISRYEKFLHQNQIDIAGIEFITDHAGCKWTYDVNVNTNYNAEAEQRAGVNARARLTQYLKKELARC